MRTSETLKEIAIALNKAQGAIKGAKKDSANSFYKSKYADLESVWESIREPLEKNGLSIVQMTALEPKAHIVTRIMHNSGEWLEGYFPIVCKVENDPQVFGSAVSYARRYALAAALGVYQTDDDAEMAVARNNNGEIPVTDKSTCTHKWIKDKFQKNMEYCVNCKSRRAVNNISKVFDDIPEDDISF